MKTKELISTLEKTMALLTESNIELRDLDQVLGDGDLGITVTAGANAIISDLSELDPDNVTPSEVAKVCAKAFANANPSTMAALVAGGLLAGSKKWNGKQEITSLDAASFTHAAFDSISARGKSQVGDKTILDAIAPAYLAMEEGKNIDEIIDDVTQAVISTRDLQSKRGRASWLQDRSIGLQDPGATAFLRLLEAWRDAVNGEKGERGAVYL